MVAFLILKSRVRFLNIVSEVQGENRGTSENDSQVRVKLWSNWLKSRRFFFHSCFNYKKQHCLWNSYLIFQFFDLHQKNSIWKKEVGFLEEPKAPPKETSRLKSIRSFVGERSEHTNDRIDLIETFLIVSFFFFFILFFFFYSFLFLHAKKKKRKKEFTKFHEF